jgi:hypothetical protein
LRHASHVLHVDRLSISDRRGRRVLTRRSDNATTTGAAFLTQFDSLRRCRHSVSTRALPQVLFFLHVALIIISR